MKVNINQVLYSLSGEYFKDDKEKPYTLKECMKNVLLNAPADEQAKNLDGKFKMERYMLTIRIATEKKSTMDISAEEVAMLKKLAVSLQVDLYGAMVFALEGKDFPIKNLKHPPEEEEIKDFLQDKGASK